MLSTSTHAVAAMSHVVVMTAAIVMMKIVKAVVAAADINTLVYYFY